MRFEARGLRQSDGSGVKITGEAASLQEFLAKVANQGVSVRAAREIPTAELQGSDALPEAVRHGDIDEPRRFVVLPAVLIVIALAIGAGLFIYGVPASKASAASNPAPIASHQGSQEGGPASPGYEWSPELNKLVWTEGLPHPASPHLRSRAREGDWIADPGYTFLEKGKPELRWTEGMTHRDYPGAVASSVESYWLPDAGYTFTIAGDPSSAVWVPGKEHPDYANVLAASEQDKWRPAPGFVFISTEPGRIQVRWQPGQAHPTAANVVAGGSVGKWQPRQGWRFANNDPADFSVVRVPSREPNWPEAMGWLTAATLNHIGTQNARESGNRGLAGGLREIRDRSILNAIAQLLPNDSSGTHKTVANMVILSIDNRMTPGDILAVQSRDELAGRLRREAPSLLDAYETAGIITRIADEYFR